MNENIKYLIEPSSIAIIGCSENNPGGYTLENLIEAGYKGGIYPVHPKKDSVFGIPAYKSVVDIPGEVECCVISIRSSLILQTLEQMHQKGVKACVIYTSGFSELGEEGEKIQKELTAKLKEYNIAACGPNCLGYVNVNSNIPLFFGKWQRAELAGSVGIVAHSGSVCIAIAACGRGFGFSHLVSCGNEAGLSVTDYFEYMLDDDNTDVIVGYLETIRNPKELARVAKLAVKKGKPIIIIRSGHSDMGQATAKAHSGALATPERLMKAFFKKNGILEVESFDELVETCQLFLELKGALPTTDKTALVSISGGQLAYTCDLASKYGITPACVCERVKEELRAVLPSYANATNPLDVTSALYDPEAMKSCMRSLASDDEVGCIVICQDAEANLGVRQTQLFATIVDAIAQVKQEITKPIIMFSPMSFGLQKELAATLKAAGIPLLAGNASMKAVRILLDWRKLVTTSEAPEENVTVCPEIKLPEIAGAMSETDGYKVLKQIGVGTIDNYTASSADEAVAAANKIGYPVAVKINSADILHKSDAHGVILNISSDEEMRTAFDTVISNAKAYNPNARIDGVVVEEMAEKGVEMILGVKSNGKFGHTIIAGTGGIFVEVMKDSAIRTVPVTPSDAREMVAELKGKKLLDGVRGMPRADIEAFEAAIVKLSGFVEAYGDRIDEIDINPLIVTEKGVKAVDSLIILK